MFELIDDIESIGDSCFNLAKAIKRKREGNNDFIEEITDNIQQMFDLVDEGLSEMQKNLTDEYSVIDASKALEIEEKINNYRNKLRKEHLLNVKEGKYKYKTGVIYNELFSTAEKLADYIINVTEAIQEAKK
jgi:phosphate:Na+ symporter